MAVVLFIAVINSSLSDTVPRHTRTIYSKQDKLAINSVKLSETEIPLFKRFEIKVDLKATYDNPFDSEDISLDANIILPDSQTITVPGFFKRNYSRRLDQNNEALSPESEGEWCVRFAPFKTGTHQITIVAKDRTGLVKSGPIRFVVAKSDERGFIRISKRDKRFFEYDNGESFYPIGANICWAGGRGTFDYDVWLKKFGENGCNFGRLWLAPHWTTFALDRPGKYEEGRGIGMFDQANAQRIDYVLEQAQKNGINLKLCIESFNVLRRKSGYPEWERTPHNVANGGILKEPIEFWTNPEMERIFKNKLRYLVARYGAYANLMSWEFWNEVDIISDYNVELVKNWHQKMATYLRSIDPYKHLITTSFANTRGEPMIDLLPEIDYVQTHHYGSPDIVLTINKTHKIKSSYGKPHYVGEIGADAGGPRSREDRAGYQVHDPMWISLAIGCSGAAQCWWWDNLIQPNDLYYLYKPFASFIKGIDFPAEHFKPANAQVYWKKPPLPPERYDLIIEGGPVSWGETEFNKPKTVKIDRTGVKSGLPVAGILHGTVNHPTKHNPITFEVSLPYETTFVVEIGGVSGYGGAGLEIILNGKKVLQKDFSDTDNSNETITKYAGEYQIKVPAGKNTIIVNNPGKDWVMASYKFKNAVEKNRPPLFVWGLNGEKTSLIWIRNEFGSWERLCAKKQEEQRVDSTFLTMTGLKQGGYQVEIWDTWGKNPPQKIEAKVGRDGELRIDLPQIQHDIAVKLIRQS
ncbi:MAG: DUF5060 domain-containing protein [Verrucomicrobiia bacterium]